MRLSRIYTPLPLSVHAEITLENDLHHYLTHVLRLRLNTPVILFNGEGGEYRGEIVAIQRKNSVIRLTEFISGSTESPIQIHLGQALCKPDRMDFVMQKATELGVTSITPLITEFGSNVASEKVEKRNARWLRIIASACEQCERNRLPVLNDPIAISAWQPQADLKIVCHLDTKTDIARVDQPKSIAVVIGSAGGLSDKEYADLRTRNFQPLSLGPRILRTETAALVALSVLQSQYGDLK